MKKKRLLKLFIALSVIVVIVVLSSTVFTLKNVDLCFYAEDNTLIEDYTAELSHFTEEDTQGIIDSGEFGFGKSIFFLQRQKNIEKIEAKYPYIKIIGISATFPDGFRIKARERQPMYSVSLTDGYAICDEELKVLEIKQSINKFDYIALNSLGIDNIEVGKTIEGASEIAALKKLGPELKANMYDRISSIKNFESAKVCERFYTTNPAIICDNLVIETRDYGAGGERVAGVTIEIENIKSNLELKINKALSVYHDFFVNSSPNAQKGIIKVYDNITSSYFE